MVGCDVSAEQQRLAPSFVFAKEISTTPRRKRDVSTEEQATISRVLNHRKTILQKMCDLPEKHELLNELDAALARISRGDYGRCLTCNAQISWATLLTNPLARNCEAHQKPDERERHSEDKRFQSLAFPEFDLVGGEIKMVRKDKLMLFGPPYEIAEDARLASSLQSSLLPQRGLRLGPWETSYAYVPARTVSGDYCDLIADITSGQLFFCFGDGMGKGIVGSIISSVLHSLFRALVTFSHEETLKILVERANRVLCDEFCRVEFGCYATVIFGRALDNGTIEFVNAGHPPAFLVRSGEPVVLEATGLPLGLFYTSTYEATKVLLAEGDAVLMYTDGVTEAQDGNGAEYGRQRLARIVQQQEHLSAEDLVGVCVQDVESFTAANSELNDDRSIMVIRRDVTGHPSPL